MAWDVEKKGLEDALAAQASKIEQLEADFQRLREAFRDMTRWLEARHPGQGAEELDPLFPGEE